MPRSAAHVRVLLDTNVLIAAFATRGICQDLLRIVVAEHDLLVGPTVLEELEQRLGDKLRMPTPQIREVVSFVREHAEIVAPAAPAEWPHRDPDDRWIVAAALEGSADVLVTGDKDRLDWAQADLPVLTPRGMWDVIRGDAGEAARSSEQSE